MVLQKLIDTIESVAPLKWQEAWDNSGLQMGEPNADIGKALLTIDVTESVVSEAVALGCNLIVSHHPLLFHGLKSITGKTPQERCVAMAIQNHIAIYSSHTSMDSALQGVSGRMAKHLGIEHIAPLHLPCGAPGEDGTASPAYGLGVIGLLPAPVEPNAFLQMVKERFGASYVRYTCPCRPLIQRVALCGGAGAEFVEDAIAQGADAYLTADFKYHEMQSAEGRIMAVDIDHWCSEQFTREIFAELLADKVEVCISREDRTPIRVF